MTFAEKIMALDKALTGSPQREVEMMARQQAELLADPANFTEMDDAYYLSDAGLSRLIWCYHTGPERLGLSSVSTDKVKARWKECRHLVREITHEIRAAVERTQR
jgi:hypothetical protein